MMTATNKISVGSSPDSSLSMEDTTKNKPTMTKSNDSGVPVAVVERGEELQPTTRRSLTGDLEDIINNLARKRRDKQMLLGLRSQVSSADGMGFSDSVDNSTARRNKRRPRRSQSAQQHPTGTLNVPPPSTCTIQRRVSRKDRLLLAKSSRPESTASPRRGNNGRSRSRSTNDLEGVAMAILLQEEEQKQKQNNESQQLASSTSSHQDFMQSTSELTIGGSDDKYSESDESVDTLNISQESDDQEDDSDELLDSEQTHSSSLQRLNTVDSRHRLLKMVDARTLGSFRDLNQKVVADNKPQTYMSRLYVTFQDCLLQLQAKNYDNRKLEQMAILIHECMSGSSRNYHSVQHVFDISSGFDDPLAILAAMFHDAIYYHVDGELTPQQQEILQGCFESTNEGGGAVLTFHAQRNPQQRQQENNECAKFLWMVELLFGYEPGQEITAQNGLNEFLSAVVAVRHLRHHLSQAQCAHIVTCIAATIPFRNKLVPGKKTHMETLYDNLGKANELLNMEIPEEDMISSIQRAAMVANADVANFGSDDVYYFLDNTWSLLTETNTTLRRSFLFTVMEFQHSLFKMNGFFNFLDPACIYASFHGQPPEEELLRMTEQARYNLEIGRKYVGAKLLSASVLAAFAALTGGDAPLSLFVGDLPSRHHKSKSINDNLPAAGDRSIFHQHIATEEQGDDEDEEDRHLNMMVYQILIGGRRSETSFDVKQSPLGAFLYAVVGDRGLTMILEKKKLYPMTEENAVALLSCLPREVIRYLAETISVVAISRAADIRQVVDNLPTKRT